MTKKELLKLLENLPDDAAIVQVALTEDKDIIKLIWEEGDYQCWKDLKLPYIPLTNMTTYDYYNKVYKKYNN